MSQTMTVSCDEVGLELLQPVNLLPVCVGESPAFTNFFDWEAMKGLTEDAADARLTRRLYDGVGIEAFVRIL